jgi:hypothetical protein
MRNTFLSAIAIIVLATGCGATSQAAAKDVKRDTARSAAFGRKFDHIRVGNSMDGIGGMTITEVKDLVGLPKDDSDHIRGRIEWNMVFVTWAYTFPHARGYQIYQIFFVNGLVWDKQAV